MDRVSVGLKAGYILHKVANVVAMATVGPMVLGRVVTCARAGELTVSPVLLALWASKRPAMTNGVLHMELHGTLQRLRTGAGFSIV